MTARRDVDRVIALWLTEIAPESHVDYLDETLGALDRVRQRPAWMSPGRWLPMQMTLPRVVVPRAAPYFVLLALVLIGLIVALAVAGGQKRLPAPFGLAATGLMAFESDGDIVVADADGSGRRPLIATPGDQWSAIFSRRGDRIAYWSAPELGDPASLFVADADGSKPRLLTGDTTYAVPDALPGLNWSPDDRSLAFTSDAGDLYVVETNGGDLRRIGDNDHERHDPVWSPDGTLIAYRGRPHADDPYNTMSTWVIAPDGTSDQLVIPAAGNQEVDHVNPSWSPDGRSIIVHAGLYDIDIAEARRDADGVWSHHVLIGGPTLDFHPSWSNSGTRFSFIRVVASPAHRPRCSRSWSPTPTDPTYQVPPPRRGSPRSAGRRTIGSYAPSRSITTRRQRTMLLIPLDGLPTVGIQPQAKVDGDLLDAAPRRVTSAS